MLTALKEGDDKTFHNLWTSHIPEVIRASDPTCAKLYFYVHVYFAVFPIHPHTDPAYAKVCHSM